MENTITTVSAMNFFAMTLALAAGFIIPAVLFFCLKKKCSISTLPFFIGCTTFLVSSIVLENIVHLIVLKSTAGQSIMSSPLLYALYGGTMAGLFEETGRFLAYRFLLKKKLCDNTTALAFGAGHGGFEAFFSADNGNDHKSCFRCYN